MSKIKLLDNKTIEKIAAGEIIERPASIIKELLENSIDAGAKNIVIEIKNGGKSYIRITDDGIGIDEEDLALAFKRHSTSKIASLEDLYNTKSLGFRGEALASISTVAKVEIMTKTRDALAGIHAIVEEGEIISKEKVGSPRGTTMIVKDLFYNLPVRGKFLKSDLVEGNHIADIIYKLVLGNLETSIKFIKDNKMILKTSRNNDMEDHIYSILGKDFSKNLSLIEVKKENFNIKGYFSNNKLYRSNRSHQYIYVNNRYISNKSITNIVENNFKSIIPINRYPVFILFIDIEPDLIDVNIHPTKQEVSFINKMEIINSIDVLLNKFLYKSISIPGLSFKKDNKRKNKDDLPLLYEEKTDVNDRIKEDIVIKDLTRDNTLVKDTNLKDTYKGQNYTNNYLFTKDNQTFKKEISSEFTNESIFFEEDNDTKSILSNLKPMGVIFNTYILAEDKLNEKIYFIDQHAAHERIMYEKFLNEFENENIVSQQLISSEIINLTSVEMSKFITNIDIFKDLGFDLSEFGSNSLAIRGVPMIFGKPNIKSLFFDLLDNLDNQITSSYDTKIDKIIKMACVNAIKAGDNLTEIEILSLFEQLKNTKKPNSCPHGRPTILEMSKKDIEKAFLRIL